MQHLARDQDEVAADAFGRFGFGDDAPAAPPQVEAPPVEAYPESADGLPDHEPANGATVATLANKQGQDVQPFETFDASQWEGVPIEPRRWIAHNRIPVGEPGIMSGDGGTGKTKLALQLGAAIAACLRDWVGGVVDVEGSVVVMSAEEKLKEMHRRTADCIEARGLSFRDLRGRLHFICDQDNPVLGAVDRNGIVQPTMSLLRLEKTVSAIRPPLSSLRTQPTSTAATRATGRTSPALCAAS